MVCGHCCYSCGPEGYSMDFNTFKATVKLAVKMNERVALAGGEPTMHPLFWDFLGYAIGMSDDVFVQTNGKKTTAAIALAKMAKRGVIKAGISRDEWHEPIDPRVYVAFSGSRSINDKRFIRDISHDPRYGPQKAGRCDWGVEMCPCSGTSWIDPLGGIHQCGCADAPVIGSVDNPNIFIDKYIDFDWKCWKNLHNPDKKKRKRYVA